MNLRDVIGRARPDMTWDIVPMAGADRKMALQQLEAEMPSVRIRPREDWSEFESNSHLTAKVGTRIRERLAEDGHAEVVHARRQIAGIGRSKRQMNHKLVIPPDGLMVDLNKAIYLLTRYAAYLEDVLDDETPQPTATKPRTKSAPKKKTGAKK